MHYDRDASMVYARKDWASHAPCPDGLDAEQTSW